MQRAMSDDEEAATLGTPPADAKQLQREARAARWMGALALVFASAAVGLLLLVAVKPEPPARVAADDALVSLAAAPGAYWPPPTLRTRGWFRLYFKSAVRDRAGAGAGELGALPEDSLVFVQEKQGNHARISQPISGWVDAATGDGVRVMFPDMALQGQDETADLDAILKSDQHKANRAKMRAQVAQFTASQMRLAGAMKTMKARAEALRRAPEQVSATVRRGAPAVAADVERSAPKVADSLAQGAGEVARKVADSKDAQKVLDDLSHQPGLAGFKDFFQKQR